MSVIDKRNISNISVSKECFKRIKILSVEKEITVQQVVSELLEKIMSKKHKNIETLEEK